MWRFHEDEDLDDMTHDYVHIIGNLEIWRRRVGLTEEELYGLEIELKKGLKTEEGTEQLMKDYNMPIEDLEDLRHHLRFRRRLYKNLRKEAQKEQELHQEDTGKVEKTSINDEVSQLSKENPENNGKTTC